MMTYKALIILHSWLKEVDLLKKIKNFKIVYRIRLMAKLPIVIICTPLVTVPALFPNS